MMSEPSGSHENYSYRAFVDGGTEMRIDVECSARPGVDPLEWA